MVVDVHTDDQIAEVKSETIDCTDSRSGVLEAVAGLPDEAFDRPEVIGEWSVRDCLAHLVGWDAWAVNALERSLIGMPTGPLPTEREINDAAPRDWADRPISELLVMVREIRESAAAQISQLTDAERAEPSLQVGEKSVSVNHIVDALVQHDNEHASQIRSWRKTQGL